MKKQREIWVDDVKVIACVLVVLGHFFQSMTKANILQANDLYQWFNQTVYLFHVPLFFICSGYLYQKLNKVENFRNLSKNVLKKALTLGVPYFAFSIATWLLKVLFSGAVNTENDGSLFSVLFLHPASPYWYLYALFFVFLITPTFKNIRVAVFGLAVALSGKLIICVWGGTDVYAVSTVLQNEIWFVFGMCLSISHVRPSKKWVGYGSVLGIAFISLSIAIYCAETSEGWLSFILGMMACAAILLIVIGGDFNREQNCIFMFLSKYTMPVFLMHTLFAAAFRAVLLKCSTDNAVIHVLCGIAISFAGPICVAKIMEKVKVLEFFVYPGKYIKVR